MSSVVEQLMRHMEWADLLVYDAVKADAEARADETVRQLFHHVHAVQWVYLHIWRGEAVDIPEAGEFGDLAAVERWGRAGHAQLREFAAGLTADALRRTIEFPWKSMLEEQWGVARSATLEETMAQVASHSTYHRGQLNRRLRELGGAPPLTDFVAWIWAGKPQP